MKIKRLLSKEDSGAIMLEYAGVMTVVLFFLMFILAFGYKYYQRALFTAVVNDATSRVAASYYDTKADLVMFYVSENDVRFRDVYAIGKSEKNKAANIERTEDYIKYRLKMLDFFGTVKNVEVEESVFLTDDSIYRSHITVQAECKFDTFLDGIFKSVGFDLNSGFKATSRKEVTSIADYYYTQDLVESQSSLNKLDNTALKPIKNLIEKIISTLYKHI